MSADNGLTVAYLNGKYEVCYWQDEGPNRRVIIYDDSVKAIVAVTYFKRNCKQNMEYV